MAFLRSSTSQETHPLVRGRGVVLRPPLLSDYAAWAELRGRSRDHLQPWEPAWPRDELTRSAYRRRLRHYQREAREDLGYAFAILLAPSEELIGGLTLTNVRRGVTQAGSLGYWIGAPFAGRGLMTQAVAALIPFAIDVLKLHRLEAATMPSNAASQRVLERNRFVREGFARAYLRIAGAWQDHVLYGLVADDWLAAERGRV
jgi:[ribosomal protein S5]-alanine N-acetyltransferase